MMALGCRPTNFVSALSTRSVPAASVGHEETMLQVRVDATSAYLPVAVIGSNVVFTDVDRALEQSIRAAVSGQSARTATWAARPLELFAEIIEVQAESAGGRMVVGMIVRATLRANSGNPYIAQTYARSSASGPVGPEQGAELVRSCTDGVGNHLAGWLAGLNPKSPSPP
jgi:hypothetical protein